MAEALLELVPGVKLLSVASTKLGFACEFISSQPLEDLLQRLVEERAQGLIRSKVPFHVSEMLPKNAADYFEAHQQEFLADQALSWQGQLLPLVRVTEQALICAEDMPPSAADLGCIKLTELENFCLQCGDQSLSALRLSGLLMPDKGSLKKQLKRLERAKKIDHRLLGEQMHLFRTRPDLGDGLWLWTPAGSRLRDRVCQAWRSHVIGHKYQPVHSPSICSQNYAAGTGLYLDGELAQGHYHVLPSRPALHARLFGFRVHPYSELPVRYAECSRQIDLCASSQLHGLLQARDYEVDVATIFCTEQQLDSELQQGLQSIEHFIRIFGTQGLLRLRTRPVKRRNKAWQAATVALESACSALGVNVNLEEVPELATGPSLEWELEDAAGRFWVGPYLRIDLVHPELLGLRYFGADERMHSPCMLEVSHMGSVERWIALLLERHAGRLPAWLAPELLRLLPLASHDWPAAEELQAQLAERGASATIDRSAEKLGVRVREALEKKIPYLVVLGQRERSKGVVKLRTLDGEEHSCTIEALIERMAEEVNHRNRQQDSQH